MYTNPNQVIEYTDGEVRQQFSLCFTTELLGGTLAYDTESTAIAWVEPERIPGLDMHPSMRLRINHFLDRRPVPYLG